MAAIGVGVPYFISTASMKAGESAPVTVIPALSIALYVAQFTTPIIITGVQICLKTMHIAATSYTAAIILAIVLVVWTIVFVDSRNNAIIK